MSSFKRRWRYTALAGPFFVTMLTLFLGSFAPAQGVQLAYKNQPKALSDNLDEDGQVWFDRIKDIIRNSHVQSTASLLRTLPKTLLARHAIVYKSNSLQEASYLEPRVMLISPRAKFILTFNGNASQKGYEGIETMRFTRKRGRPEFIFEEIVMPDDLKDRKAFLEDSKSLAEIEALVNRGDRTGANAETCTACHRADPRPNFAHYNFWPGFYGSLDDQTPSASRNLDPISGESSYVESSAEATNLPMLINRAKTHPRYRFLIGLENHLGTKFDLTASRLALASLTQDLSQLNFERVSYLMRQSKDFDREKLLLTLASLDVDDDCNLSLVGQKLGFKQPLGGFEAKGAADRRVSPGVTYDRLSYAFQNSKLPWEDFFMDFLTGPGNTMETPGLESPEFLYFLLSDDPKLRLHFETERVDDVLGVRGYTTLKSGHCPTVESLLKP